jgi:hypothetical protein
MKVVKGKKTIRMHNAETRIFRDRSAKYFFQGSSDNGGLPAYFWADNCDYDEASNCYVFSLSTLANKDVVEEVYIPREYVLLTMIQKTAPPPGELERIGFRVPTQKERTSTK